MKSLLDELDPFFAAAAVAIAGLTIIFYMPEPPVIYEHPPIDWPAAPDVR